MKIKGVIVFILIIFLVVVAFVGLPYIFTKLKSINFNFTSLFSATSSPSFLNFKRIWSSSPISNPSSNSTVSTIKTGESIYKGKVRISGVNRSSPEEINLSAAYSGSNSSINISGWKIKSTQRGIETIVGKGLALPQFNSFLSDIQLKSGDSVKITAGISPLFSSFQINSCFGWLNNIYNLGSSFNYCPSIQLSDLVGTGLDSACKETILRYGSCQNLNATDLNRLSVSGECRLWIEKNLNYSACVQKHLNESNFYKGWRVYTGNGNLLFDQLHDKIELRDQAGLLVDSYEY